MLSLYISHTLSPHNWINFKNVQDYDDQQYVLQTRQDMWDKLVLQLSVFHIRFVAMMDKTHVTKEQNFAVDNFVDPFNLIWP